MTLHIVAAIIMMGFCSIYEMPKSQFSKLEDCLRPDSSLNHIGLEAFGICIQILDSMKISPVTEKPEVEDRKQEAQPKQKLKIERTT